MKNVTLLVWLTQFGLTVAVPPACFILLAVWLHRSCDWGSWVVWVGVIMGVFSAVEGLRSCMKILEKMSSSDHEKEPPVSFNDHE